jgi:hypothetical protein
MLKAHHQTSIGLAIPVIQASTVTPVTATVSSSMSNVNNVMPELTPTIYVDASTVLLDVFKYHGDWKLNITPPDGKDLKQGETHHILNQRSPTLREARQGFGGWYTVQVPEETTPGIYEWILDGRYTDDSTWQSRLQFTVDENKPSLQLRINKSTGTFEFSMIEAGTYSFEIGSMRWWIDRKSPTQAAAVKYGTDSYGTLPTENGTYQMVIRGRYEGAINWELVQEFTL